MGLLGRWPRKSKRAAALGATILLATGLVFYSLFGPRSPDAVCRLALRAIDHRDVTALMELTHPDEIKRLHLTKQNVASLFNATLWRASSPSFAQALVEREPEEFRPQDRVVYSIFPRGANPATASPLFAVAVTDSQDQGWRLDLTWLLYTTCLLEANGSKGRLEYARLCRQYGIGGMMGYAGDYLDIAEIERRAGRLAAQGR